MSYEDLKDLARRINSDKILHNEVFDILSMMLQILSMMDINKELLKWFINSLRKCHQVIVLSKTKN